MVFGGLSADVGDGNFQMWCMTADRKGDGYVG